MRNWVLIGVEWVAVLVLALTGHGQVALGLACGGSLALTIYNWPVSESPEAFERRVSRLRHGRAK